jgi:16S rRNA (guanine527-N7)-methyltransferase
MQTSELLHAATRLGVALDDGQVDRLRRYAALLEQWNAGFNLVSRRDIGRLWPRHILDSLSIAPLLAGHGSVDDAARSRRAIDIGTGAGLPGIPLAIVEPEIQWELVDRNQRKIRFLERVAVELELENVSPRALDLGRTIPPELVGSVDLVVSRAVAAPADLIRLAEPLLAPGARMVLMTGAAGPDSEPEPPPQTGRFRITAVHDLVIPGLDRTHEVTIMERAQETAPPERNEN